MSLVELARYATKVEADLARLELGSHGIEAVLFDEGLNNIFGGAGLIGVRLMVDDSDRDEAVSILTREGDPPA